MIFFQDECPHRESVRAMYLEKFREAGYCSCLNDAAISCRVLSDNLIASMFAIDEGCARRRVASTCSNDCCAEAGCDKVHMSTTHHFLIEPAMSIVGEENGFALIRNSLLALIYLADLVCDGQLELVFHLFKCHGESPAGADNPSVCDCDPAGGFLVDIMADIVFDDFRRPVNFDGLSATAVHLCLYLCLPSESPMMTFVGAPDCACPPFIPLGPTVNPSVAVDQRGEKRDISL